MTAERRLSAVPDLPADDLQADLQAAPLPRTLGDGAPRAVVDGLGQGWAIYGEDDEAATPRLYFAHSGAERRIAPMTLDQLASERGPVRPVSTRVPPPSVDYLTEALAAAGPKAALSVAAAMCDAVQYCGREKIPAPVSILISAAENTMAAQRFLIISKWARDHATANARIRHTSAQKITEVLVSWATHPLTAFDVPAVLAEVFAHHADATGLGHGLIGGHPPDARAAWRAVADQYLQPTALRHGEALATLYHYLMSASDYYDADLFPAATDRSRP